MPGPSGCWRFACEPVALIRCARSGSAWFSDWPATVLCIVMERLAFSHLLDFSSDYRVSGPFSAMGLGGAYVECYLVVAMPFLLARILPPSGPVRLAAGALLLAGACYALLVTYSRGGYLAMVVGGVVMMLLSVATPHRDGPKVQRLMLGLALLALAATMSYPVLTGSYAQSRLQTISADLDTRERHWRESLKAMHDDGMTLAFGTGLGRFAEAYSWASPPTERPGGHRLISDAFRRAGTPPWRRLRLLRGADRGGGARRALPPYLRNPRPAGCGVEHLALPEVVHCRLRLR